MHRAFMTNSDKILVHIANRPLMTSKSMDEHNHINSKQHLMTNDK